MLRRFWLKLRRRNKLHEELQAELEFHRQMAGQGGNPTPFGNPVLIQEQALDMWRFNVIENLWRDVRYAARGLVRDPVLLFSALVSLGLGIGANTTLFSLAAEFLLSEPSVTNSGSLLYARLGGNSHSKPEVLDFVRRSGIFEEVAGEHDLAFANWNDGTETRRLYSVVTTRNFFTTLGVPVALGRGYGDQDNNDVVVLQHQFWRRYFNSDPSILGRNINIEGRPYTVLGVLPEQHRTLTGYGYAPDIYIPFHAANTNLAIYARLKPGQSQAAAMDELKAVAARLDTEMPEKAFKYSENSRITPIAGIARLRQDAEVLTIATFFVVLLAVAGLVLAIACVNVASLLLARAAARRREIAVRLALGAGRARLLQQLLVESLLLAMVGAAFGFSMAHVTSRLLTQIPLPLPIPISLVIATDWRVVIYAALLTVAATLICGLLPAWQSIKQSMTPDLHRAPRQRLRRTLVATQIAVSLVVLTTGFLFLRNMLRSENVSPGFDVRHTVRAEVNLPAAPYKDPRRIEAYVEQALQALESLPAVEAVAAARIVPFTDASTRGGMITLAGTGEQFRMRSYWNWVSPGYFRAMGIPLETGRTFLPSDRDDKRVVIVNQAFVRRYFGGRNPIGVSFLWGLEGKTPYQVVGVVAGTKNITLGETDEPQAYEPLRPNETRIQFIVRSALPPASQLDAVRSALRKVEPAAGAQVQTLLSAIGLAFLPSQVGAGLMGAMGLLGLLLAAVGLYGTLVYSVARRSSEIAVRLAIGAARSDVAKLILVDSMKLIGWGSVAGLLIAFFLTRPLSMFLVPSIKPDDPVNFLGVALVFVLMGAAVAIRPAMRAASIDAARSLRVD